MGGMGGMDLSDIDEGEERGVDSRGEVPL